MIVHGFEVIDRSNEQFLTCEGVAVRYHHQKTWDIIMYHEVRIRFVDGRTGDILATVSNQRRLFSGYTDGKTLVSNLFGELDSEGFFRAPSD